MKTAHVQEVRIPNSNRAPCHSHKTEPESGKPKVQASAQTKSPMDINSTIKFMLFFFIMLGNVNIVRITAPVTNVLKMATILPTVTKVVAYGSISPKSEGFSSHQLVVLLLLTIITSQNPVKIGIFALMIKKGSTETVSLKSSGLCRFRNKFH
jgi:hypothetical protein